jgi:hypothetical protein
MFESEDQLIEMWVRVKFTVADLDKTNNLKLIYSAGNLPIALEDAQGNMYTPVLALEKNAGQEAVLVTDFKEELGLSLNFYYDSGISNPYYSENS